MTGKKKNRSTSRQLAALVDYMTANPNLATGAYVGPLGHKKQEADWMKLKDVLNKHGPEKSVYQWKISWCDLKKRARSEKSASNKIVFEGRNQSTNSELCLQTQKILAVIGSKVAKGIKPEESQRAPTLHGQSHQPTKSLDITQESQHAPTQLSRSHVQSHQSTKSLNIAQSQSYQHESPQSASTLHFKLPQFTKSLQNPQFKSYQQTSPRLGQIYQITKTLQISDTKSAQHKDLLDTSIQGHGILQRENNQILKEIVNELREANVLHRQMIETIKKLSSQTAEIIENLF